ncbi:MAG: AtpZ/AtpI family protein [Planctomycetota bacterium]|nr:AtpZ/AtpI family protein [Planctomycetota bacterium]
MKQTDFAKHATLGIEFFASVAIFAWLGYKLDQLLGFDDSFPLFLLAGVFLGLGIGVYRLYLKINDSESSEHPSDE